MTLTNFEVTGFGGLNFDRMTFANVDVTTGCLWRKRTVRRQIAKKDASWFFVDTGEFTPGWQAENLSRAWEALHAKNQEHRQVKP